MSEKETIFSSQDTDIEVARKVLGLEVAFKWIWLMRTYEPSEMHRFEDEPPPKDLAEFVIKTEQAWLARLSDGWKYVPKYTTSIRDAHTVLEHLRSENFRVEVHGERWDGGGGEWFCQIKNSKNGAVIASGMDMAAKGGDPSFPLAVCRAALRWARIRNLR